MPPKVKKRLGRPPKNSKPKKTLRNSLKAVEDNYLIVKPQYKCNECPKVFKFEKSFIEHLTNNHSKLPGSVSCDNCNVSCPNLKILKDHIIKVHGRETFDCSGCGKKFVRQSHVDRHKSQSGCGGKKVSTYPCAICNSSFTRKDNLMVHLRLSHIRKKQYKCKQCNYSSQTFNKIIVHTQKSHWGVQYVCDICGTVTKSRAAITKHLEAHGEKKFGCEVCGYSTHTIEVIRRHVLTHVEEKPYKCSSCGASFIQRKQLVKHLHKHVDTACNICNKAFTDKDSLMKHMESYHEEDENLSCTLNKCPKYMQQFSSAKQLQKHLNSHSKNGKEEVWACEVCGRRYKSEKLMRKHVVTHTLERPRRCMYCVSPRAYVRGLHLVRHVRIKHTNIFKMHLLHVRQITNKPPGVGRVKQSELDAILSVLDAESERILEGTGPGVLYGGMQEVSESGEDPFSQARNVKSEEVESPLMSEDELASSLQQLLAQLINADMLECFGWPDETVDVVLEKLIDQCGANPADSSKWSRVQCLRENAKQLFLHVVEDKNIANMLYTHTIDQIIKHILEKVSEDMEQDTE